LEPDVVSLHEKDSVADTVETQTTLQTLSAGRGYFWVIFPFMAIQTLLALIINFSRIGGLFYLQPVVSVIFCVMTLQTAWANTTSVLSRAVMAVLIILAYLLATAFFFITAIFIGGLPG
jgi:hypothetical protein